MTVLQENDSKNKNPEQPKTDQLQEDIVRIIQSNGTQLPPQKIREIAITIATRFSGPIPSPHLLAEYEQVLPGCAHRIMKAFEEQTKHRIELETRTNKSLLFQSALGQIMGGFIVVGCLGITAWMGFIGHVMLAGTIGTTTVVSLATIYFLGKRSQQSEVPSKKDQRND